LGDCFTDVNKLSDQCLTETENIYKQQVWLRSINNHQHIANTSLCYPVCFQLLNNIWDVPRCINSHVKLGTLYISV